MTDMEALIDHHRLADLIVHGFRLAAEENRTRLNDAVWCLLKEAAVTLQALPDRERQWLRAGNKATWPLDTSIPAKDWREIWNERIKEGMNPYDEPITRHQITDATAIDRMLWSGYLLQMVNTKNTKRDRAILWQLAAGVRPGVVQQRFMRGRTSQAMRDVKKRALLSISTSIRQQGLAGGHTTSGG